jgi:hypothetical protein
MPAELSAAFAEQLTHAQDNKSIIVAESANEKPSLKFVCLFLARQSPVGKILLIYEVSRSHTTTHNSV